MSESTTESVSDDSPTASKAFRAFNDESQVTHRNIARQMIDTEGRDRLRNENYRYSQQPGLKFRSDPDEMADDLKYGIDDVEMYMSESKPGLLCIDVTASTIDHGMVDPDEMGLHPPKSEHSTFVKVICELYGRFSASTEMFEMAVSVKQHPMHNPDEME